MLLEVKRGATSIPTAAVLRGSRGTFVYVVKSDDTVAVRPITLGPAQGENVAVEAGIEPGERVVVDGADKLREGAKVDTGARDAPAAGNGPRRGGERKGGAGKGGARGSGEPQAPAGRQ